MTKKSFVEKDIGVSMNRQLSILGLSKGCYYYKSRSEDAKRLILSHIVSIYEENPIYGYRKIHAQIMREGVSIGKDRVLKYMRILGLRSICPIRQKKTTIAGNGFQKYPYLLNDLKIEKANQVWAVDITYIRMSGGFVYFVAIIDWYSKYLLSYRISNSMDINFCKEALNDALKDYGRPEIFNSDQGSQFTSIDFTKVLLDNEIMISMDSKGRAIDNRIIERFFRSLKYEDIYIYEYKSMKELKKGIDDYVNYYNNRRLHQTLEYNTPYEVYNKAG